MNSKPQFESTDSGLLVRAPAKINLSLLIAGKRDDGFHNIETMMAKVDCFDELLIRTSSRPGIHLTCTGPHWAPEGPENLVYKAAKLLCEDCGLSPSLELTLTKNIPAGSGLGGGSSDAAATLMGINHLMDLRRPKTTLAALAATLGSDVAFFIYGPLSYCTGKGELIDELHTIFDFTAALILPSISVSTPRFTGPTYTMLIFTHSFIRKLMPTLKKTELILWQTCAQICYRIVALAWKEAWLKPRKEWNVEVLEKSA